MDVEASEGAVALEDYPLKVVDTAGVAGGTDTYMDVVGDDTIDTCMEVVVTHLAEVFGYTTNTVQLLQV